MQGSAPSEKSVGFDVLFHLPVLRAEACLQRLAELNPYVSVTTSTAPLDPTSDLSVLSHYQVEKEDLTPPV